MATKTADLLPDVVAIVGSAGGIRAMEEVLEQLPADLAAAVIVVIHLTPQHRSILAAILTGAVDHVLPLREIGAAVIDFVGVPA